MKLLTLTALSALALAATAAPAEIAARKAVRKMPAEPEVIPGRYIVRFKPETKAQEFTASLKQTVERENAESSIQSGKPSAIDAEISISPMFQGVSGRFSEQLIERLKKNDRVAEVIPDMKVYAFAEQLNPPSWGISRISRRSGLGSFVFPDTAGAGVDIYIIDSGIATSHRDFGFRATNVFKAESYWPMTDDNGHGTHVAGTAGGSTFGVAKRSRLLGVKVLDNEGFGSLSGIIAGVNFVASRVRASGRTAVANLSLGSGYNRAVNQAVAAAFNAGIVTVVAAGNDSTDACNISPASEPSAITVGATTRFDAFDRSYSNGGRCIDILAPGTDIVSSAPGGGTDIMSGTSMAAPHVAGAAALWLGVNTRQTAQQVRDGVLGWAKRNVISSVPFGTPNLFLYTGDSQ